MPEKDDEIVFHEENITSIEKPAEPKYILSGFFRRIIAFSLDMIFLGIIGFIPGLFLSEFYMSLGSFGRFYGLAVAVLYFGIFNSRAAGGSTPGKMIMGIKVVDKNGRLISVQSSMARSFIVLIPVLMNGIALPCGVQLNSFAISALYFAIFGMGSAVLYLLFFNLKTRQLLHDALFSTYVIMKHYKGQMPGMKMPLKHIVISVVLLIGMPVSMIIFQRPMAFHMKKMIDKDPVLKNLYELEQVIYSVMPCTVTSLNYNTFKSDGKEVKTLNIGMKLASKAENTDELMQKAVLAVIGAYKGMNDIDGINVNSNSGYDIGIVNYNVKKTTRFTKDGIKVDNKNNKDENDKTYTVKF